jgi:purine/pyrimidine-nucleoside phosphorylase
MIKHIVFFKLSEDGLKQKDLIVEKLNSLKDDIDFIRALEVGINFDNSDRAFDLSLTVVVDSKDALNNYAVNEKHVKVVEFIKSLDTQTKVVDYEIAKAPTGEFGNASIIKKANLYFDGQVTSRTVIEADGNTKTLGIMMPGTYTFGTDLAEHMEILAGHVEVEFPDDSNKETIKGGEYFEVPANSSFDIKVLEVTDYCCTYIK